MADEEGTEGGEVELDGIDDEGSEFPELEAELFGVPDGDEESDEEFEASLFPDGDDPEEIDDDEDEDDDEEEPTPKPAAKKAKGAENKADPKAEPKDAKKSAEKPKEDAEEPEVKEPEAPKTFKARVNGKDYEYDADKASRALGIDADTLKGVPQQTVTRLLQKQIAADHAMDSSKRVESDFEKFVSGFKGENRAEALRAFLSHESIGLDPDQVVRDYLAREFELKAMTPEQRQAHEAQQELARIKAQHASALKQQQAELEREKEQARQEQQRRFVADLTKELGETLEAEGLPKHQRIAGRIVNYMREDHAARQRMLQEDPSDPNIPAAKRPKDYVERLRADLRDDLRVFAGSLKGKELREFLGEDIVKELKAERVSNFKQDPKKKDAAPRTAPRARRKKPMTYDELLETLDG